MWKKRGFRLFQILILAALVAVLGYGWQSGIWSQNAGGGSLSHPAVEDARSSEEIQAAFDAFVQQIFQAEVTEDTLTLNFTILHPEKYGIEDAEPTLGEYSLQHFQDGIMTSENWLASLEQYKYAALTQEQQLEYDILHAMLETDLKSSDILEYMECLGPTTGIQAQLPLLLAEYHFSDKGDIEDYLALLNQIPDYFEQVIAFEQMKSQKGIFMGDTTRQAIIEQCQTFVEEPEKNYLISTFEQGIKDVTGISSGRLSDYRKRNKKAVLESVIPAYQALIEALTALEGTGNNEGGACKLPKGKEYYEYLVQSMTGSGRTMKEIGRMIDKNLMQSQKRMSQIMTKSPDAYYDAKDVEYPCSDPIETVDYLRKKISTDFEALPEDISCRVKYVDESLEDSLSPAMYLTSPIDDYKKNVVYLNQSEDYDLSDSFSTIAHESYPGHLYQNAYFLSQNPAPLRTVISVGGYVEGWGTYAEKYSYQLAGFDEKVTSLMSENLIATLCLYAKADMEVNYNGWSRKQLISYLREYGFDAGQSRVIYDSVVAEPVSYMQYTLGYLEIEQLKDRAENQLGGKFSLKEFHKFYLGIGPAPFVILQDRLEQWIDEQKNR